MNLLLLILQKFIILLNYKMHWCMILVIIIVFIFVVARLSACKPTKSLDVPAATETFTTPTQVWVPPNIVDVDINTTYPMYQANLPFHEQFQMLPGSPQGFAPYNVLAPLQQEIQPLRLQICPNQSGNSCESGVASQVAIAKSYSAVVRKASRAN